MDEEKSLGGVPKKRNALGDVTNVVGKKEFSAISGDVGGKAENRKKGKAVYLGVENVEQKNCLADGVFNDKGKGKVVLDFSESCLELNELGDYFASDISKVSKEDDQKESSRKNSQGERSSTVYDQLGSDVADEDANELGDDDLESSKSEFNDYLIFPESQESRSSVLERCVGHKGDGVSSSPVGMDLIKNCSCSFCTKVAYIWSDLHYQDIKGRLAALKKSQKEADVLVQSNTINKAINIHGQVKPDVERLQSSLMGQWRSLFLHMEDIYGQESNQLVANLNTLKNLRDNCKTELE